MKIINLFFFVAMCLLWSCQPSKTESELKTEILEAEKAFQKMTTEKGISEAFYVFADENAVIKRENDTLIIGKNNIKAYYAKKLLKNTEVTWSPDFIEVSQSGDMAYTYGKYLWKVKDSTSNIQEFKGVFHTVWKRQPDGSWKYVWD